MTLKDKKASGSDFLALVFLFWFLFLIIIFEFFKNFVLSKQLPKFNINKNSNNKNIKNAQT